MDRQPRAPGYVRWVTRTLEAAGYETWAVGGAIRNTLLGLPEGDWDMTTRAPPGVVRKLFHRTVPVGIEHGTVGVLTRENLLLEVTTFRKDVETFGRHAVVEFADTLEEDLARRDFTINAVAWHPLREEFRDPFGGRGDLRGRLLRTVGDPGRRFSEDYLRVLRALRFSGRFGLRVEDATWQALVEATRHLPSLSSERIREELMKVLSQDDRPSGSLAMYGASGALDVLLPEVAATLGVLRPGTREDLFAHALLLTDLLPASRPILRLTALLHGVGVPEGPQGPGADGGEEARERGAAVLFRLRFSNAHIRDVTELLAVGLEPPLGLTEGKEARRWLSRAGPHRLPDFARIWLAKARLDRLRWKSDPGPVLALLGRLRRELSRRPALRLEDLAVNGRDLIGIGLRPGPRFGEILDELLDRVLTKPSLNHRERLLELVREELVDEREEDR